MRAQRAGIGCLIVVGVSSAFVGGCESRSQYAREVKASRATAYREWESRKNREDEQQPKVSGKLTLEDSVKLTLGHNKMLERTLQEREIAHGQVMSARSAYLPNVGLTGRYARDQEVPSFDIPTGDPNFPTQHVQIGTVNNYSAVLTVTQPLYAGGAIRAQVQVANLLAQLADETIRATTQDVVYTAETAYYNLLLDQHLVDISTEAVRAAKAHLDNVEKRRAAGVASDFDVLRAQVELSNFEADLIKSKNAIIVARANLIKTMGVSQDSDFKLSDEFVYETWDISIEQAVQAAFTNRPDLYSREYQIRQQREQLTIARSKYLPNLSGFFTNTWSNPSPTSFGSSTNDWGEIWQAGFQGAWPIFDGFQREGAIAQQKARLRQARIDLVDTEETALYELTQALLSMQNAEEFVQSQRMNLKRATEGLRLADVGYQQGINTQVEVIDAQSALTKARVNYYQAIYSHVAAKLALRRAMGTIIGAVGTGTDQTAEGQEQTPTQTQPQTDAADGVTRP